MLRKLTESEWKVSWVVLGMLVLSTLVYLVFFLATDASALHFYPVFLNDQVNYINVARNLSHFGHMTVPHRFPGTGTYILPALLAEPNSRLYMPGFYLVLAAFLKAFGFSTNVLLLPNMLFFIFSTVLVCLIANALYGKKTAILSSLFFILLPANVFFAATIMMEMSVIFTSLLAFYLLLCLPNKFKAVAVPFLIALPFHFRETAFFLLIPMLAHILDTTQSDRKFKLTVLITLSTLLMVLICSYVQAYLGRYGVDVKGHILRGEFNYNDAFAGIDKHVSLWRYPELMVRWFFHNFHAYVKALKNGGVIREAYMISMITQYMAIALSLVALLDACFYVRNKFLPFAFSLFPFSVLLVCLVLYTSEQVNLTRVMLFSLPFPMIQASRLLCRKIKHFRLSQCAAYLRFVLLGSLSLIFVNCTAASALEMRLGAYFTDDNNAFLEAIDADPNQTLVASIFISASYIFQHYPRLVSFMPANDETLGLLNKKYPVGTLVIQRRNLGVRLSRQGIARIGLVPVGSRRFSGKIYDVFKRPHPLPGSGGEYVC